MLSFNCKSLRVTQAEYYLDSNESYYSQEGTVQGVWLGNGARQLGLSGRVKDREDVIKVFQGFAPHGLKVQNAGKPERRAGYDLTFSAPKSVTALLVKAAALGEKDQRFAAVAKEIRRAQLAAVAAALTEFERTSLETRVGKGGYAREKGTGAVAIAFEHVTSRPAKGETLPDPQLHTHLVVVNMTTRADRSVGTVDFEPLRSQQKMPGQTHLIAEKYAW